MAAFPFYWMLITAFKTDGDLYNLSNIPFWFNDRRPSSTIKYLFKETLFARWLLQLAVIGVCVVRSRWSARCRPATAWRA